MLSNAYFLAKFRFDTAENEPAKHLQNFANFPSFANFANSARPNKHRSGGEMWRGDQGRGPAGPRYGQRDKVGIAAVWDAATDSVCVDGCG